jgi:hypothetical protein
VLDLLESLDPLENKEIPINLDRLEIQAIQEELDPLDLVDSLDGQVLADPLKLDLWVPQVRRDLQDLLGGPERIHPVLQEI